MRRIGLYSPASIPSFVTLVSASTPKRQVAMQSVLALVTAACAAYDLAAPDVHTLNAIGLTKAQRAALIDGYDHRTVAVKRRLATMIESLPASNADLCPYCSLDTNPDLDHFLPKAKFPEFSLHAANLIPICTPCNRKKLNAVGTTTGQRILLNAFFEPTLGPILEAEVIFSGRDIRIKYHIDDAGRLSTPERDLVKRHYKRLGLGDRYARRARSYLAAYKAELTGKSRAVVARTLASTVASGAIGEPINGWKPAIIRAVAAKRSETLTWLLTP